MLAFVMAFGAQEVAAQPSVIATLPFGGEPIALNPTNNHLYVGQAGASVGVVDIATNTLVKTFPTAGFHTGIVANPVTNRIYIAQQFAGRILVIDGTTDTAIADVPVPGLIHTIGGITVNPGTGKVYVNRSNNGDIIAMDGLTFAFGPVISLGGTGIPWQSMAAVPTTNRIYISPDPADQVVVIDGATDTVVATIPVGGNPYGISVNTATKRIYVANNLSATVSVVDDTTNMVIDTIPVGSNPVGVAMNQASNRIYVANNSSNDVSVIDGNSNTVVATVPVGLQPSGVVVNPNTNLVYVGNATDGTISVIEDSVPFAAFSAKVEIALGPLANVDTFEVKAPFTLGSGNDGIDPLAEDVSFKVGTFSTSLPAGSFKKDKKGRFKFEGVVNGVALEVVIRPLGGVNFEFKAEGQGADLTGTVNPVTVGLTIGNDTGGATVTAEFK